MPKAIFLREGLLPHEAPPEQEAERLLALYEATVQKFGNEVREERLRALLRVVDDVSLALSSARGSRMGVREEALLKLKLARHFQNHRSIDTQNLIDALLETPKFLQKEQGSLVRLLEIHETKTLQKVVELRKAVSEREGNDTQNPYEALFTTVSGEYYLARLSNKAHLEEESAFLKHCVGTSDSYINKMKRGDVEIFSLRRIGGINEKTGALEKDTPLATLEYEVKTGRILQIRTFSDYKLRPHHVYSADVLDALGKLRSTKTDKDSLRTCSGVEQLELECFDIRSQHVLTQRGEISVHNLQEDDLCLKFGRLDFSRIPKESAVLLLKTKGITCTPEQVAYSGKDINEHTKVYFGSIDKKDFFHRFYNVEHVYTKFPEGHIRFQNIEIGGKDERELEKLLEQNGYQIYLPAKEMMGRDDFKRSLRKEDLNEPDWKKWKLKSSEEVRLICLRVEDLGFTDDATTGQIFARAQELGLEFCPPEVGPHLRLQYNQPMNEYVYVGMNQITNLNNDVEIFSVVRGNGNESWLNGVFIHEWGINRKFAFRLPKPDQPKP